MTFVLPEWAMLAIDNTTTVIFGCAHPGDHSGGVTPVPIPNTAVKPSSVDGTARVAWWESRTSPGFFSQMIVRRARSRRSSQSEPS